ncbi:TIGR03790 family protein [bacterium]|nr:TIGR03790 family protein [bacterium]
MVRPVARTLTVDILLILLILLLTAVEAVSGGGRLNVMVVQNQRSTISASITNYYVNARDIPPENVCRIACSTDELVSKSEFDTNILAPIRSFLQNTNFQDSIDYIVLTKGVPLKVVGTEYGYGSPLSITSILTCAGETSVTGDLDNPYGPMVIEPVETAFSHTLDLDGYHLYLVTRLDGYTFDDIKNMIDRSSTHEHSGSIVLDRKYVVNPSGSTTLLNGWLTEAQTILSERGIPTVYDDTSLFVHDQTGLMGYFSWGSNDGSFTYSAYISNTFAPGGIADSYVSSSGRTFLPEDGYPDSCPASSQSLIADMITNGACGVSGFVAEPYTAYATYPQVLFDRYTKGYNMAESFYMACPKLFWRSVIVGDPLMAPYSTPPTVEVLSPEVPITGTSATISAMAASPSGISRVDFYMDDKHLGTASTPPYSITFDSTQYTVGPHEIDVRATDASSVAVQGWTSTTMTIENPISNLSVISDAFPSPDGQGVRATAKVVSAGTAEMGGAEFYIQEENGTCGIRIVSSTDVMEGDVVTVVGNLATISGERSIEATSVEILESQTKEAKPFGMPNKSVGGSDINEYTLGVTDGCGLRNIGILIRTWGTVTYVGDYQEDFFYIDDGSGLEDGSGYDGIRVVSRSLSKPVYGQKVCVTGVSSCKHLNTKIIPIIKLRKQADIFVNAE